MTKKGEWADNPEALTSQSRGGVITIERLVELGVPRKTCYDRCAPGQPWRLVLPGVLVLQSGPPTRWQLVQAALLYARGHAIVTGAEACRRHGLRNLPPDDRSVRLLIPHARTRADSDFVVIERTKRFPDPLWRDDIPLAPVVRAVLDTCRCLGTHDSIAALVSEAVQRAKVRPDALLEELGRGSNRGTALTRKVLLKVAEGARSVAEMDAMSVWRRTKLAEPLWNFDLLDRDGNYIARPDGWFDEVGLAWEIDSFDYHFDREGYARTLARNARYAAAGVPFVQTTPSRLRSEPVLVAAELVAAHLAASLRPRPPVQALRRSEGAP
ncbi:hypothetical protein SAMN05421504_10145 [Amycolatopsis xylanica]|uniref:Transcriptional regulator, AbiEi antitoxin, Type IV TA system n=1 Tax=Amycolatopsis xylanica TaxID=589385 RepID=A0A1H2RZ78_9PSEU|nr:hypothetical protein [Amycolatopsis xylanica]SDW24084.1 hypothetical protein SAMN05421504_10145 [Amycolatopsis xylanica]